MGFLTLNTTLLCSVMYIIYEAESFAEYTQSAYTISLTAQILFDFFVVILKADTLFDFIDNCEIIVNTRKSIMLAEESLHFGDINRFDFLYFCSIQIHGNE